MQPLDGTVGQERRAYRQSGFIKEDVGIVQWEFGQPAHAQLQEIEGTREPMCAKSSVAEMGLSLRPRFSFPMTSSRKGFITLQRAGSFQTAGVLDFSMVHRPPMVAVMVSMVAWILGTTRWRTSKLKQRKPPSRTAVSGMMLAAVPTPALADGQHGGLEGVDLSSVSVFRA